MDYEEAKKTSDKIAYWLDEITSARKREKSYRQFAKRVVELYEGGRTGSIGDNDALQSRTQYNILYSNTDTMSPALYNTTPRPVVQRRYKDEDPLAKAASTVTQRVLEFQLDDGEQEYSTFDDLMRSGVLEALVPGRGVTKFKFDAKIEGEEGAEKVTYEKVCGEEVPWDRFLHGYAKKWSEVPWIAYEHHFTRDEVKENFGKDKLALVNFETSELTDEVDGEKEGNREEATGARLACIYEIWSKTHKKVFFVSACCPSEYLKEADDPLKLTGFFPSPKPMSFVQKISTLVPVPLYKMYEDQAKELNLITVRLNKLIAACRVRGMYDAAVEGIAEALKADDNILTPGKNVQAQGMGATLEKAIWLFPLESVISVIQQLYVARQQVKSVIFEITGIADIMRGSSQASETLGAQEIKNQWGTLRLKRAQKEVMRYVRDCLRITAEIAVTKLSQETIRSMTGLPYPTQAEKAQAQAQLDQMKQEFMMIQQQAQMTGQQPPEPPQPPPELMQVVSQPTWEEILGLLKNDLIRSYRVDIETNSTVDAEATEDKQNISELLNAMAQFLNGVAPLIESGILPFEAAQAMLLAIVRRFRFGTDVEDSLKQMKPPQPQDDGKAKAEQAKMQMEGQRMQAEMAIAEKTASADMQMKQLDIQAKQQQIQLEMQKMQMELEIAQAEHQMKMAEIQMKAAVAEASARTSMQTAAVNAQVQERGGQIKLNQQQQAASIKDKQMKQQAAQAAKPKPVNRPD